MSRGPLSGIGKKARNWIGSNIDILAVLVEADGPIPLQAWPEDVRGSVVHAADIGAIKSRIDEDSANRRSEYYLSETVEAVVESRLEDRQTLPCGHSGLRNLGGGRYACSYDGCDEVFLRATAEEAFAHA